MMAEKARRGRAISSPERVVGQFRPAPFSAGYEVDQVVATDGAERKRDV